MVAQMHRIENAARVALGAPGSDHGATAVAHGMTTLAKLSFAVAAIALTALIATTLL